MQVGTLGEKYSVVCMSGVTSDKLVMALDDILQITRASLSLKASLIGEEGSASFSPFNTILSAFHRPLIL
jgi:hypothetical protein